MRTGRSEQGEGQKAERDPEDRGGRAIRGVARFDRAEREPVGGPRPGSRCPCGAHGVGRGPSHGLLARGGRRAERFAAARLFVLLVMDSSRKRRLIGRTVCLI